VSLSRFGECVVVGTPCSPVQSRFVIIDIMVQYIVKSTGSPLESTGVHVDYVGEGKVLLLGVNDSCDKVLEHSCALCV
jgi:hypothetical protein